MMKEEGKILAKLIVTMLRRETHWIGHFQEFICSMLNYGKISNLVATTVIHIYVDAVIMCTEGMVPRDVKDLLQRTCEYLVTAIADNNLPLVALEALIAPFFDRISQQTNIIESDAKGCSRIIVGFLSPTTDCFQILTKTLTRLIRCGENREYGRHFLRLCASEPIARAITLIIVNVKSISVQKLALQLACHIQK